MGLRQSRGGAKGTTSIPEDVRRRVRAVVERFNHDNLEPGRCQYEARFRGAYCYLYRLDLGREGPICRLGYKGEVDNWEFAIFKWSTESYDPREWMFPGAGLVDGTVEGAMRAGLEAYPA